MTHLTQRFGVTSVNFQLIRGKQLRCCKPAGLHEKGVGAEWEEDVPVALAKRMQAQFVCNLCSIHGIRQILFVGKHQQDCITQLILQSMLNVGKTAK